ncbi:MAG: FlgD immunoglobulin-like domain containing protein [Candidatus Krumholzibacteria bacterium]|nr:FlgD immunoglobulin-like domain containing protein [Candidatus Krumholzibacteria bacterium]
MKPYVLIAIALLLPFSPAGSDAHSPAAESGVFPHQYLLDNGVSVRVYLPGEILEKLTWRDDEGRLIFRPEGGGAQYILIESVDDPCIANRGDGEFFPMDEETVLDALRDIDVDGRTLAMEIDIYLLPLPRRSALYSSASAGRIFLSPGTRPISAEVTAWTVTHEFGHCFQHRYLPLAETALWAEYLGLRGILDDPAFSESAAHMYRPTEVFAEDFRALFGGEASCYSGTIENTALVHPAEVAGLGDWIAMLAADALAQVSPGTTAALAASNYPNPFNPVTTISAVLGADDRPRPVDVRIYAADGSIVRRLYSGTAAGREFSVAWDGRRDGGGAAASGVYFYRISSQGSSFTGKMLLLR